MIIAFDFIISIAAWYALYGFECLLNGAGFGRKTIWFIPFECFWEEILWNLPGGRAWHTEHKIICGSTSRGIIIGRHRNWHYQEVIEKNLYGPFHLLFYLGLIFWPLAFI